VSEESASSSGSEAAPTVARPLELLAAFAEAHGVGGRAIAPMRATGIANDIWALGDDLVMRVGRDSEEAWSDARTETIAVPAARRAGVRTPELVVFDLSRSILDAPVTVYRRVPGDTLGMVLDRRADWSAALRGIGRDLARLHLEVAAVDDPGGWLDQPDTEDTREWLEVCARAGFIGAERRLVERWIDRLEPAAHARVQPRFLHNDVHPFNVMVDRAGDYLALLDWGDAGWGDPAIEFATLTVDRLGSLLDGYGEGAPALMEDEFVGRVLWNQIGHALRKAARPRSPQRAAAALDGLARLAVFAGAGEEGGGPGCPTADELIHGSGDSAFYWHLLARELRERGHDVVAMDLPCDDESAGLSEYTDAVVEAIGDRTELIVVAQSFGAFTAPLVCARVPVELMVLVAGMIPRPGERGEDWSAGTGFDSAAPAAREHDVDDDSEIAVFYHDVPPALAAEALRAPRPASVRVSACSTSAAAPDSRRARPPPPRPGTCSASTCPRRCSSSLASSPPPSVSTT
jgi:aminoglycoside phosphotransferase (APT) family kinase protein